MTQGVFPIERARQELGFTPTTAVRAAIDVRGTGGTGAILGQALIKGIEIYKRRQQMQDANSAVEAQSIRDLADAEFKSFKLTNPQDTWEAERKRQTIEVGKQISKLNFSSDALAAQQIKSNMYSAVETAKALTDATRQLRKETMIIQKNALTEAFVQDDPQRKIDQIKTYKESAAGMGMSKGIIALNIMAAKEVGEALRAKNAIENIKPGLIATIEAGDKTDGYKVLNAATKQLVKNGILTEAEAAEANKKLGDWMDNYVAGRIKSAKDTAKLSTRQTYIELMPTLLDTTQAQQRYDIIDKSALLKADKEKWYGYIKGSYQDAPTENVPRGHTASFAAVYDAATLQLSPKDAYDALLELRFNKKEITDEQFQWAVDKIENPYPNHLIEDINAIVKSNLEDFNKWLSFDNERNKKVNESLLAWVDELIKQDKVPLFDFKKTMAAMSSQFRTGDDRWYDVGQTIRQGGTEWEVVGFDEDGEPVVEELQ